MMATGEEARENIFQELDEIIYEGRSRRRKIIVAGDFQVDPDESHRGTFMKSWAMGHHLCISNIEISKP